MIPFLQLQLLFVSVLAFLSLSSIQPTSAIHSFCTALSVPPLDPAGIKCYDGTYVSTSPTGCCLDPFTNQPTWPLTFCYGMSTDSRGNCIYRNCAPTYLPNEKAVDERFLDAHNYFRCLHYHPPLSWSDSLALQAASHAEKCVFEHSSHAGIEERYGENLAIGYNSPEESVEGWYSEFYSPGYTPGTKYVSGVGHYTALIWRSTSKLGCGVCVDSRMDVCQYQDKAPNMNTFKQYADNVPQTRIAPDSVREEYCCNVVYGEDQSATNAPSALTNEPSGKPTWQDSLSPSGKPTWQASKSPSFSPSAAATEKPTQASKSPSVSPSAAATEEPTQASKLPSFSPSATATEKPTISTSIPTAPVTSKPTQAATLSPTATAAEFSSPPTKVHTPSPSSTPTTFTACFDNDAWSTSLGRMTLSCATFRRTGVIPCNVWIERYRHPVSAELAANCPLICGICEAEDALESTLAPSIGDSECVDDNAWSTMIGNHALNCAVFRRVGTINCKTWIDRYDPDVKDELLEHCKVTCEVC